MVGKDHYGVASGYGSVHSDITKALYALGPEATRTVALVLALSADFEDWYWSSHPRFPEADSGDGPTLSKGLESLPIQVQKDMEDFRKIWQGMHAESLRLRKAHRAFREAQRAQNNPAVRKARENPIPAHSLTRQVFEELAFLAHVRLRTDGRPPSRSDLEELKHVSPDAEVYMDWIMEKGARQPPAFPPVGNISTTFCRWVVAEAIRESRRYPLSAQSVAALSTAEKWVRDPTHSNAGDAYIAHAHVFSGPIADREIKGANLAATTAYLAATSVFEAHEAFLRALRTSNFQNFIPLRVLLLLDSVGLLPEPVI
jgi:hypothetical protein